MLNWITVIEEFIKLIWEKSYIPPTDVLVPTYLGWVVIAIAIIYTSGVGYVREDLKTQASKNKLISNEAKRTLENKVEKLRKSLRDPEIKEIKRAEIQDQLTNVEEEKKYVITSKEKQDLILKAEDLKKKGIRWSVALILLGVVILLLQEYVLQALFAVICFVAATIVLCIVAGLVFVLFWIIVIVLYGVVLLFKQE